MKVKSFIRNIITICLIIVICICGYKIYSKLYEYKKADNIYNDLRKEKNYTNKNSSNKTNKNKENSIDFSHINKDFVCWINIKNTNIDYPVVQGDDNSYYLHRDIYENYLYAGTTFLDYRNNYNDSKNLIVYGHNMKNTTMFSELEKFKKEDFFNSNPTITLTNKNGERHFKAFAVLLVDKNYDYRVPDFKNDEEYNKFLNKICDESMFKVKDKPTSSDKIMTLTTCSYEFKNARTVVICKEIDN